MDSEYGGCICSGNLSSKTDSIENNTFNVCNENVSVSDSLKDIDVSVRTRDNLKTIPVGFEDAASPPGSELCLVVIELSDIISDDCIVSEFSGGVPRVSVSKSDDLQDGISKDGGIYNDLNDENIDCCCSVYVNFDVDNDALLSTGDHFLVNRNISDGMRHGASGCIAFEFLCVSLRSAKGGSMLIEGCADQGKTRAVSSILQNLSLMRAVSPIHLFDSFNVVFLNGYDGIFKTIFSRLCLEEQSCKSRSFEKCVLEYFTRPGRAVCATIDQQADDTCKGISVLSADLSQTVPMTVVVLDDVDQLPGIELVALLRFINTHPLCSVVLLATCDLLHEAYLHSLRPLVLCDSVRFQQVVPIASVTSAAKVEIDSSVDADRKTGTRPSVARVFSLKNAVESLRAKLEELQATLHDSDDSQDLVAFYANCAQLVRDKLNMCWEPIVQRYSDMHARSLASFVNAVPVDESEDLSADCKIAVLPGDMSNSRLDSLCVVVRLLVDEEGGDMYHGEVSNGRKHGYGTMVYHNGDMRCGLWEHDVCHGFGCMLYATGDIYCGEFWDGFRAGNGAMLYANSEKYVGFWIRDLRQGFGVMTYRNGDVFDGHWFEGNRDGEGTLILASGDQYFSTYWNKSMNMFLAHGGSIFDFQDWPYHHDDSGLTHKKLKVSK